MHVSKDLLAYFVKKITTNAILTLANMEALVSIQKVLSNVAALQAGPEFSVKKR